MTPNHHPTTTTASPSARTGAGEPLDADILAVLDSNGELTMSQEQLRRFIAWEAAQIGLTFAEAVQRAEVGTLPRTAIGSDVDMLIRMLAP